MINTTKEPPNGDYVAYIKNLTSTHPSAPGEVMNQHDEPSHCLAPGEVTKTSFFAGFVRLLAKNQNPFGKRLSTQRQQHTSHRLTSFLFRAREAHALKMKRATTNIMQRRPVMIVAIVAIAMTWVIMRLLIAVFTQPDFKWDSVIPVLFLLLCAGIFLLQVIRKPWSFSTNTSSNSANTSSINASSINPSNASSINSVSIDPSAESSSSINSPPKTPAPANSSLLSSYDISFPKNSSSTHE